jgi:hypothetical protein
LNILKRSDKNQPEEAGRRACLDPILIHWDGEMEEKPKNGRELKGAEFLKKFV